MRADERAALLGQCVAMRNVLEGIIATLESEPDACEHPDEQRKYDGDTMGSSTGFVCGVCGAHVATTT